MCGNGKSGFSETVVVALVSMTGLAIALGLMQIRDEERRSTEQVEAQRAADRTALELARRQAEAGSVAPSPRRVEK